MDKRPALGKGLSALIPDAPAPRQAPVDADIDRLMPNDFQPRGSLDEARLQDLAQSIRANGLIQPIVVRKAGDRFQIIAGERRWRAAKLAGLLRVPIVVRDVMPGEKSQLELALVENIQREDLNPIDEALAYKRLADQFQLTQEQIAVGGRQGSRDDCEPPPPVETARRSPHRSRVGTAVDGPCARAALAGRGGRSTAARAGCPGAQPVGARDRIAGQENRRRWIRGPRTCRRRRRWTCTRAPRRIA